MELDLGRPEHWSHVSRIGGSVVLTFYFLFLFYAWRSDSGFLFIDFVNLVIHEARHSFFSWGSHTLMILGGTLGELIVPLLCASFFFFKRQTHGLVFSLFWFFENFLYIGTYMADARTASLPLVNADESDWTILFNQWGVLLMIKKSAILRAYSAGSACSRLSPGWDFASMQTPDLNLRPMRSNCNLTKTRTKEDFPFRVFR
jgi:hypothetical protein